MCLDHWICPIPETTSHHNRQPAAGPSPYPPPPKLFATMMQQNGYQSSRTIWGRGDFARHANHIGHRSYALENPTGREAALSTQEPDEPQFSAVLESSSGVMRSRMTRHPDDPRWKPTYHMSSSTCHASHFLRRLIVQQAPISAHFPRAEMGACWKIQRAAKRP